MDSARETRDLMKLNVDSRPAPAPIRLFGKLLGGTTTTTTITTTSSAGAQENEQSEMKRREKRFKCHYCWRSFPTSQALGGHQNAHKRERQLAKRTDQQYDHYALMSYYPAKAAHNYEYFSRPIHPHSTPLSPPISQTKSTATMQDRLCLDLNL